MVFQFRQFLVDVVRRLLHALNSNWMTLVWAKCRLLWDATEQTKSLHLDGARGYCQWDAAWVCGFVGEIYVTHVWEGSVEPSVQVCGGGHGVYGPWSFTAFSSMFQGPHSQQRTLVFPNHSKILQGSFCAGGEGCWPLTFRHCLRCLQFWHSGPGSLQIYIFELSNFVLELFQKNFELFKKWWSNYSELFKILAQQSPQSRDLLNLLSLLQDGKAGGQRRKDFVQQCHKELGMAPYGNVVRYSERHLDPEHVALFNQRELESLDIQHAYLTATWLPTHRDFNCWVEAIDWPGPVNR